MQGQDQERDGWSWARLLRWAGLAGFLSMSLVGVALGDLEAMAMAVALGFGVSLFLLQRGRGWVGPVGLAAVSTVTFFFMLPAALTNLPAARASALAAGDVPRGVAGGNPAGVGEPRLLGERDDRAPRDADGGAVEQGPFWHTFIIDELGVDLLVPVHGRRGASFAAAPGTYQFVCRIPGHVGAGMEGTLTVEG